VESKNVAFIEESRLMLSRMGRMWGEGNGELSQWLQNYRKIRTTNSGVLLHSTMATVNNNVYISK
jgi:hypothetical protein